VYFAWPSPSLFADDDAELDLVGDVLANGKTSRLYKALVYEQRIATEVAASQNSRELGSFFQVVATAAPGRTLAEVERAITRELTRFSETGPTASEIERCLAQAESHFLARLQTLGNPGCFSNDLERYRRASAEGLRRAAARWLSPEARVVLSVVPKGRLALALEHSSPVTVS
jgi:zinc protease